MEVLKYAVIGIAIPLFWWVTLSTILWLVRKFAPRWERTLFSPLGGGSKPAKQAGVSTARK